MIYLDNYTAAEPSRKSLQVYETTLRNQWLSPDAAYFNDSSVENEIQRSLDILYELVGAKKEDRFVLTSSGAEGVSQVFHSVMIDHIRVSGKNHLLLPCTEGANSLMTASRLEKMGCSIKLLPVDSNGQLTRAILEKHISPRTGLLSISWVNALTGVVQPLWEIASYCKEKNILLHVNGSEIIGKGFFRFQDLPVDFFTFDGNRFYAPRGTGGLFIKKGVKLGPLIPSGNSQWGDRGGVVNLAALFSLATAAKEVLDVMDEGNLEIARLRNLFEDLVTASVEDVSVLCKIGARVPTTTVVSFPRICNELLLYRLAKKQVFASIGGGEMQRLEHLLGSMGVDPKLSKCAISFTLSQKTKEHEIRKAGDIIANEVKELLSLSQNMELFS